MSATADPLADPEALETEWDLRPLLEGEDRAGVEQMLDEARERAGEFAETYAGQMAHLDVDRLETAMRELEAINETIGRVGSYASLRFATDTAEPAGVAHPRLHLQHAGLRQDGRGPAARLPPLAGQPEPVQRGVRRVGDGADRGGACPLRHPAALVQAQGQADRGRPPGRLRPLGARA